MPAYDPNNIFAKVLRGEIPSIKVYEDSDTVAIMDIMPQADGHVLVLPRAPSRNILDADPAVFKPLFETVQVVVALLRDDQTVGLEMCELDDLEFALTRFNASA